MFLFEIKVILLMQIRILVDIYTPSSLLNCIPRETLSNMQMNAS